MAALSTEFSATTRVIHQFAVDISLNCLININQVSDDWFDVQTAHAVVCTHTHPGTNQRFTIGNGICHADMFLMRLVIHAMRLRMGTTLVMLLGEMGMSRHLVAHFMRGDLALFNGMHGR